MTQKTDILDQCLLVLTTANPREKAHIARQTAALWRSGEASLPNNSVAATPPERPSRPNRPELTAPCKAPRRRLSSPAGRIALLHAIAHIELNAIDLAFDLITRFIHDPRISTDHQDSFIDDWISVGDDEARHFVLIADRLEDLGAAYGDLSAHDGLWDAAQATAHDLAARLAVAPMVLEARGLDVTPPMIERLISVGDRQSAEILQIIYQEEIGHVAAGARWFRHVCQADDCEPIARFHTLVRTFFAGQIKPPFNTKARDEAGFAADFYLGLVKPGAGLA
jgi:uncharacterized ferritin-like protein (DUF455 family)